MCNYLSIYLFIYLSTSVSCPATQCYAKRLTRILIVHDEYRLSLLLMLLMMMMMIIIMMINDDDHHHQVGMCEWARRKETVGKLIEWADWRCALRGFSAIKENEQQNLPKLSVIEIRFEIELVFDGGAACCYSSWSNDWDCYPLDLESDDIKRHLTW